MLAAELARMQQQEADTKAKQLEVKHELESHDNTIKENQQRIRHWKKEVSHIMEFVKQNVNPLHRLCELHKALRYFSSLLK